MSVALYHRASTFALLRSPQNRRVPIAWSPLHPLQACPPHSVLPREPHALVHRTPRSPSLSLSFSPAGAHSLHLPFSPIANIVAWCPYHSCAPAAPYHPLPQIALVPTRPQFSAGPCSRLTVRNRPGRCSGRTFRRATTTRSSLPRPGSPPGLASSVTSSVPPRRPAPMVIPLHNTTLNSSVRVPYLHHSTFTSLASSLLLAQPALQLMLSPSSRTDSPSTRPGPFHSPHHLLSIHPYPLTHTRSQISPISYRVIRPAPDSDPRPSSIIACLPMQLVSTPLPTTHALPSRPPTLLDAQSPQSLMPQVYHLALVLLTMCMSLSFTPVNVWNVHT